MHLRFTDANNFGDNIKFYKTVIQENRSKDFLVCTDDINYAKSFLDKEKAFNFQISNGTPMDDFYLLTSAKELVIAPSSFSWWAGKLNNSLQKYWISTPTISQFDYPNNRKNAKLFLLTEYFKILILKLNMLKKMIKKYLPYLVKVKRSLEEITLMFNMELEDTYKKRAENHPNPLASYGQLGFSQSDEDGLTKEFIKRLGIERGFFLEFGVGTGIENNSLVLLALNWSGIWLEEKT